MDIRKYFGGKASTSKQSTHKKAKAPEKKNKQGEKDALKKNKNDDDDDDFVDNPRFRRAPRSGKKCTATTSILSDSDSADEVKKKVPKVSSSKSSKSANQDKSRHVKDVDVQDFFGSKPVQQTDRSVCVEKKKDGQLPQPKNSDQASRKRKTYFDDDFDEPPSEKAQISTVDIDPPKEKSNKLSKVQTPTKTEKISQSTSKEKSNKLSKVQTPVKTEKTSQSTPRKNQPDANSSKIETSQKPDPEATNIGAKNLGNKAAYRDFVARDGPRALGSREIPKGQENCLSGLVFVITGVLDTIERETAIELIQSLGGKVNVSGSISKKTNYLVVGRDPGLTKLEKAKNFSTKQLDENSFYDLISTMPAKPLVTSKTDKKKTTVNKTPVKVNTPKTSIGDDKNIDSKPTANITPTKKNVTENTFESSSSSIANIKPENLNTQSASKKSSNSVTEMWVDKYKPSSIKAIVGQQGAKSCVNKLLLWLKKWHENNSTATHKHVLSREMGFTFKAALLSGPPGIGKTTSALLVCRECNYDVVELNASDARGKKGLEAVISEIFNNKSIAGFTAMNNNKSKRLALVMDEVDGMSGNDDRGGMQELISIIKKTKIPIICMCNDRNHPKIRSLANYCFDLRFQRPRSEQICSTLMSIAFKEGVKITPQIAQQIVTATNQDIRQSIHNLNMWCANSSGKSSKAVIQTKNIKLGPFEAIRKVFDASSEASKMTYNDKAELFFTDYSLMPLFVQENYPRVVPVKSNGDLQKTLDQLSEAADSISCGDLVNKILYSTNRWGLLPTLAAFGSVIPGAAMQGYFGSRIDFPSWLGKNSRQGKYDRILQELALHMRIRSSANHIQLGMEYVPQLRYLLSGPLTERESEGVTDVIDVMDAYFLTRDDWSNIMDIGLYPGRLDPTTKLSSKVKSAFSRAYNKMPHLMPYASQSKVKRVSDEGVDEETEESAETENTEEETKIESDPMIKSKKAASKAKQQSSTKNTSKRGKSSNRK